MENKKNDPEQKVVDLSGLSTPEHGEAPQPETGDVVISADKIDNLMAEQRAAARAKIEQEADAPAATPEKESEAGKQAEPETAVPAEQDEQKKSRRGRPPKDKADPEAGTPKRRGRPPKEKAAGDKGKAPTEGKERDTLSQSERHKMLTALRRNRGRA